MSDYVKLTLDEKRQAEALQLRIREVVREYGCGGLDGAVIAAALAAQACEIAYHIMGSVDEGKVAIIEIIETLTPKAVN